MRPFRYRLAAVLKRAHHIERTLQMNLARLEAELQRIELRLGRLRAARDSLHRRLRALHADDLDLGRVNALRTDLDQVDSVLDRVQHARRALQERIAAARERLLQAARERQSFEKHRDGLAQRHRRAEIAAETKRLDDLATVRYSIRAPRQEGLQ